MVGAVGVGEGVLCPEGEEAEEAQLPQSGSVLPGSGPAQETQPEWRRFPRPSVPKNLGSGDMVFSERKEIEVWASGGTLVSRGQGTAGLRFGSF